ncbi:MAG: Fe-S cluster assembly protein SufD [Candidatus Delongbacteria bacterium]|jgi:Fe-S cluster assembly protein SufD|nr:Fe-S cluster assembly protein SufD [Candidatus Delongbacteria bacterium]
MEINNYTKAYTNLKKSQCNVFPDIIRKEKDDAFDFLKKHGLPGRQDERYRYLDFDVVFDEKYSLVLHKQKLEVDLNEFFHCEVEDLDTELILLSNGFYYDSTHNGRLPDSVIVCSMQEAFHKYPTLVSEHFNRYLKERGDGWAALNTMLANDGVFIHVPDNIHVPKPIQIVNLTHGFYEKELFQRNLFVVGENASLKLVLCDHSLNNAKTVSHLASELYVGKNAGLQIYNLQNEPDGNNIFNHMAIHQEAGSELLSFAFSLHGGSIRNNIYATLNGPHANSNIFGLTLSDRQQHMDNFVFVDHAVPDCTSNAFFKSILDESSSGAFSGRVLVQRDAQRTTAYQTNNNICLTNTSQMRTKPQLEIYADDVKCSHGATIGQLDEEAMFYLRTRGIDKAEARFMMMFAFANEVVRKIDIEPLRNRVESLVSKRLRGDEVLCEHCLLNCNER